MRRGVSRSRIICWVYLYTYHLLCYIWSTSMLRKSPNKSTHRHSDNLQYTKSSTSSETSWMLRSLACAGYCANNESTTWFRVIFEGVHILYMDVLYKRDHNAANQNWMCDWSGMHLETIYIKFVAVKNTNVRVAKQLCGPIEGNNHGLCWIKCIFICIYYIRVRGRAEKRIAQDGETSRLGHILMVFK